MNDIVNPKADAWDLVGGLFWKIGRKNAKPNDSMIASFLSGVSKKDRIMVIGASTKFLVEAALLKSEHITVIDFSSKMCEDLREEIHDEHCSILVQDILSPPNTENLTQQNVIIAERLVNRFSSAETQQFFNNIRHFLAADGLVRLTIKLGLYEIDKSLIAEGERKGTLLNFYDQNAKVIDFSQAKEELKTSVVAHGDIPRDLLIRWYEGRGKEARFDDADILQLINKYGYKILEHKLIDEETNTFFYEFKR